MTYGHISDNKCYTLTMPFPKCTSLFSHIWLTSANFLMMWPLCVYFGQEKCIYKHILSGNALHLPLEHLLNKRKTNGAIFSTLVRTLILNYFQSNKNSVTLKQETFSEKNIEAGFRDI